MTVALKPTCGENASMHQGNRGMSTRRTVSYEGFCKMYEWVPPTGTNELGCGMCAASQKLWSIVDEHVQRPIGGEDDEKDGPYH